MNGNYEDKNIKEPIIIGKLKKDKDANPFIVFLILLPLIATALFLPDITDYVKKLREGNPVSVSQNKELEKEKDEKDNEAEKKEVEQEEYYNINASTSFTIENFIFSSFSKAYDNDYYLNFSVANTVDNNLNLKSQLYFFEIYSAEKSLVERVKINNDLVISSTPAVLRLPITSNSHNNGSLIIVKKITEADYPLVSLNENAGVQSLKCNYNNDKLVYYFANESLTNITHNYTYQNTNLSIYNEQLAKYQNLVATNTNKSGILVNLSEGTNAFTYSITINLNEANINQLANIYYYPLKTSPRVINFEMESYRFVCS